MPYEFRFNKLKPLCKSMRRNEKCIEHFSFVIKEVVFDCILDIGISPFEMVVGVLKSKFVFTLYIREGFVTEMESDDFFRLRGILDLDPGPNPFTSFAFLRHLDSILPPESAKELAPPEKVAQLRKDQMTDDERKEGFIFSGWLPHKDKNNGHVTEKNLNKTLKLLGMKYRDYCRRNDISTKWTNIESERVALSKPWE